MKAVTGFIIVGIAWLFLAGRAGAQSQRESLPQLVQQLQAAPGDSTLRARIIMLGATMKPAPAIPEEANRAFVKGNVFQKEAKDASGYQLAIASYRDAVRLAPWWGDAYYNLAVSRGLAEEFDRAIAAFKLYMASVRPGSAEARDAQNRIYELEASADMAAIRHRAEAGEAGIRAREQRISGTWKGRPFALSDGVPRSVTLYVRRSANGNWDMASDYFINNLRVAESVPWQRTNSDASVIVDGELRFSDACYNVRGTVSADGSTLNLAYTIRTHENCPNAKEEVVQYTR